MFSQFFNDSIHTLVIINFFRFSKSNRVPIKLSCTDQIFINISCSQRLWFWQENLNNAFTINESVIRYTHEVGISRKSSSSNMESNERVIVYYQLLIFIVQRLIVFYQLWKATLILYVPSMHFTAGCIFKLCTVQISRNSSLYLPAPSYSSNRIRTSVYLSCCSCIFPSE